MEKLGSSIPHSLFMINDNNKRDFPWRHPDSQHQHHQQQQRVQYNHQTNWSSEIWGWDSINFVAKSSHKDPPPPNQNNKLVTEDDANNLTTLNLLHSGDEEPSPPRSNKRLRSGSPNAAGGSSTSYPICQVDDCKQDLSKAKDYHRRHKVCENHSKTTRSLVRNQLQRFCQQCSRFHPLSEFDEGKRSCRRRLAGHNKRRRKTQQENVASQLILPASQENNVDGIFSLLSVLAQLQGKAVSGDDNNKTTAGPSIADEDRVKMDSQPVAAKPATQGFDLNISEEVPLEQSERVNGSTSASSTVINSPDVHITTLGGPSSDPLRVMSRRSSPGSDNEKTKLNSGRMSGFDKEKEALSGIPSDRGVCTVNNHPSSLTQEARHNFPLQLFSSSPENETSSQVGSYRNNYYDSSDPMDERSPTSSPLVAQKLFPVQSETEGIKHGTFSVRGEDNGMVVTSSAQGCISSFESFKRTSGRAEERSIPTLACQAAYSSSSGSDNSPSSSNSDSLDRTGRIIFKLFDKDPSNFPASLKTEVYNWLSNSPSEMESYIRPGCVVLSIYLAMPATNWTQLQEGLLRYAESLVKDSVLDFWRSGRFLIHLDRQLVSHRNGKIRSCKSWKTLSTPELLSVSPLAVVSGQETLLVLRGRNLSVPGTTIHCTYMGRYISKNVIGSTDICIQTFEFPGKSLCVQGRCFIEVENGFKGTSFPLIISNANICGELRLLESELTDGVRADDIILKDQIREIRRPVSRENALQFLNELGWLFQKSTYSKSDGFYFSLTRLRYLLVFSVERDWSALTKTLLDIFVASNTEEDGLSTESRETLDRIQLLSRAVKRKCVNMVNLLIQYTFQSGSFKTYLFLPNKAGHDGITPLHVAACTDNAEHVVDALTSDSQKIGLTCWTSQRDETGQSPYGYASLKHNHNYNKLVARKLAELKCDQISIAVGDSASLDPRWILDEQAERPSSRSLQGPKSCTRCSIVMTRHYKRVPSPYGVLHRPYLQSLLAIAAVCACVCLFLRGSPYIGRVNRFKWENVDFGTS